nr:uncharacterized protein si:dkey-28a3.2 [Gasterosteus aculeatus aculeatus]XP_040037341.1 uncharacterized protein si:dkey-28a3.2 [Gasterosteus aculeatus aculeatus]
MPSRIVDQRDDFNPCDKGRANHHCWMRTDGLFKLAMPTAKDKSGSTSHRYRPASEYDDATLNQKRQYWRTKKREQRARLTERRIKGTQGGKILHLHAPAVTNSTSTLPFAAFASPLQSNDDSCKKVATSSASPSVNVATACSVEATDNQEEKWLHSMKLDILSPQLPASCSISAKASRGNTVTARGTLSRAVTSHTPSGTQLNTRSSVPPFRVTRTTNGSSTETTPQSCGSMQSASAPKTRQAQVALRTQPNLPPTNVTTGAILMSSPCVPDSIKRVGRKANTTPQSGTKNALVTLQGAKGVSKSPSSSGLEEEQAARRREHWRIKKREQRAKLAAQLVKARERAQSVEFTFRRQTAQKTGLVGGKIHQHLPSQPILREASKRQFPTQVKTSFTSAKRENDELQSGTGGFATANRNKVTNAQVCRTTQTAITCDATLFRKPGESTRRFPSYLHLSNVARGTTRCKTPRQRFIDAQKNFMNQRNIRCKSPLNASFFASRNFPQIDPNDTPEQIIAKRREYWRIKKREQRARLSMDVKSRLKERDSLMRRVKRYQSILEEMRRARALAQSAGSSLTHASETIGGFIKEDGTVTINIPQVPSEHNSECHVVPYNTPNTKPQHHPNTNRRVITPIRVTKPPPPLLPAQVKVSFPLDGQSLNKPPRLLPVRQSTASAKPHRLAIQTVGQLTLTHPQTPQNVVSGGSTAGSNLGACVMKMAISSNAPSLSALSLDPELTEEERMAKKREYWRIKKREQRAARAARLKQGVLQARASVTLQRRRAQRKLAIATTPPGRSLPDQTRSLQSIPNNRVPVMPHANEIKQENESMPEVDLNSQLEQAICPDIKAPSSPPPPPPPAAHSEPDSAVNADSQATTLLAVASMKKLLEESLSTVTECSSEQSTIKLESTEASEQEMEPNLPPNKLAPIAPDLTLEIKSWPSNSNALVQECSPSPHLKDSAQSSETIPPLPISSGVVLPPTCEHSSQTHSNFIVKPSMEASPPRRTQRQRTKKAGHQSSLSAEPPKLHHLPQPQQQHSEKRCQAQEECQNSNSRPEQGPLSVMTERSGLFGLQRKREYWKLMKRQQRARLRARQRDRSAECSSRLSQKNIQASGLVLMNTTKGVNPRGKAALYPEPPVASPTAVASIPSVLLVSHMACNAEQSHDALRVKLPVNSVSCSLRSVQNHVNIGPSQIESYCQGPHENPQQAMPSSRRWMSRSTDLDLAPSLPFLKPPDNPLSSINLQPIEPPPSPNCTFSPIKIPCSQLQNPTHMMHTPTNLAPITSMPPPKPIPGECEEDFLRRKREYWRIKKKEQRARKAIRDKGVSPRRASNNFRTILPAQEPQTQDSGQWLSSSEESEHLMSNSEDTDMGSFSFSGYTAPDNAELLFTDYEDNNGEEGSVSDAVWRNRYLMDYDPLNQLLVCMVCGELQYSHSLEGVRAHIDEAHPDTLALEPREQRQILEAWDEQVSQRERFFTSQLQQHSGTLEEAHRN